MTTTQTTLTTTQVYQVWINATPEAIWQAITDPEWNKRYGYEAPGEYELRVGGAYRVLPSEAMAQHGALDVIIDGEVLECDPPHKLVQSWHALFDPETAVEPATRLTWEVEAKWRMSKLTVTHELEGAPKTAVQVAGAHPDAGGGWSFIISDLKTLLETGKSFAEAG